MFSLLPDFLQEEMIAFCMGNRGLKITYDPFFKYIFHPVHKEGRLAEVLSLILQEDVEIVDVLPVETDRFAEKGSLLIMDILVKLKSGAYANVEIQKVGYRFQGERCACYSSDLLMRQLSRKRAEAKRQKKEFSYKSLQKVYTIVLMERVPAEYWKIPDKYIHHAKQSFDTGLKLDLLQEYFIIPLDVFRQMRHNGLNKLEAWLYFIGSDEPKDIYRVIEAFPEFKEYYNELLMLRYKKRELIEMYDVYREALRAADEGTVKLMIGEQLQQIEAQSLKIGAQEKQIKEQGQRIKDLQEKEFLLQGKNEDLQGKNEDLQEKNKDLQAQNEHMRRLLAQAKIKV